jgi:hypothetical protein
MSALRTFLGLSIVLAAGCGGSSSTVGDGGAGTGSSGGSSGGTSSGGGSSSGTSSSGGGTSVSGDDSSVATGDDSGLPTIGPDGGVVVPPDDAGTGAARDAGGGVTMPGRGTDGGPDQIACGATPCNSATQVCCVTGGARTCTSAAGCRGEVLACSGSNSCPTAGDVCCAVPATGRTGTITSKCETACPMGSQQLCTTNADCAGNDICRRLGTNYNVCEAPLMPPPPRDGGIGFPRGDAGH